jgi:iron complex transport system substrate-binding protein
MSLLPHGLAAALLLLASTALSTTACRRAERPVHPPPAPKRVVSLAPNLTEIVYAVGAGETLVGVSDYSDFPPAARSVPRVGGLEVSAERVASLRPDLVLASAEGGNRRGAVSALDAAGVRVLLVPGGSLDEVLAGIRLVGRRLDHAAESERLVRTLEARRRAVAGRAGARRRPRAILLVWPEPPQAAGGRTFLDDVLTEAGAENLLARRPGWPVVSAEWLATAPIEVVILPDSAVNRPVFARSLASGSLSRGAVAKARIVRVDESSLTRPGPRVFDALEQIAREIAR